MRTFFCFDCNTTFTALAHGPCPDCGGAINVDEMDSHEIVQELYEADQIAQIAEQQAMERWQR